MRGARFVNFNILLIFSLYYIFYQFDYYQGHTEAPFLLVNFIKLFLVSILFFSLFIFKHLELRNIVIFFYVNIIFFSYIVFKSFIGLSDYLFFNFIIFSFLILIKPGTALYIYRFLMVIISLQVLFDLFLWSIGIVSLWQNGAFIGGMGNPSTFGMTCIYLLFFRKFDSFNKNLFSPAPYLLMLGAALSQSMLAFLWLLFYLLIFHWKILLLFFIVFFIFVSNFNFEFHVFRKMQSLLFDGIQSNNNSESVYGRVNWLLDHLQRVENGQLSLLLGDIDGYGFISGDNGILSILSLGGLPLVILFTYFVLNSLFKKFTFSMDAINYFILFNAFYFFSFLIFNRALEYFPFAFIFFISIGYLRYIKDPLLSIRE